MALSINRLLLIIFMCVCMNNALSYHYSPDDESNLLLKKAYGVTNKDSSIRLAQHAFDVAMRLRNNPVAVKSLTLISENYWDLKRYNHSETFARRALSIAQKYQLDSLKGDCWLSLGMISYSRENFRKSIDEYNNA